MPASLQFDWVVVGAGVFGLYASVVLSDRGHSVAVVDLEPTPLSRASLVNQARIHAGYHYPRSVFTAVQASTRTQQFVREFPEAVMSEFRHIYGVGRDGSLTDVDGFRRFCEHLDLPLKPVDVADYFDPLTVEAAFEAAEFSFDATMLRQTLVRRLETTSAVDWHMGTSVVAASTSSDRFELELASGVRLEAGGIVNAAYAGCNHLLGLLGIEPLPLKFELCEVVLGDANDQLRPLGLTLMDGPFFSVMPFGKSGLHSLWSVDYSPHRTSAEPLPTYSCQQLNAACHPGTLDNCTICPARPVSAWPVMRQLTHKFLRPGLELRYRKSLYTVKAVLEASETDDGRPTFVVQHTETPPCITVLSGKVTTLYDLMAVL